MVTCPPIYVINLKRVPERRLHIQRQMDALGINYQFIDAIDKVDLKSSQYRSRISRMLGVDEAILANKYAEIINRVKIEESKNWENVSLGWLACMLSHIKVYDLMVKNSIDMACILEDDAKLLPNFVEVLKIASQLEWDILLLAHYPTKFPTKILKKRIKRVRIFNKDLLFSSRQLEETPITQKEKDYRIKRLMEEYGFNSRVYCKQSKSFANAIKEYDSKYVEIAETIMPTNRRLLLIKPKLYIKYKTLHRYLKAYILTQFSALPEKNSLNLITECHYIAEPKHEPYLTTAYLVNQSTAMKWKHEALANNPLAIDETPWELYKNTQAKLRIITPPCATPTHSSFKYSSLLG